TDLSNILNLDVSNVKLIYGLYDYTNSYNKISLSKLINFICNSVIPDSNYSNLFTLDSRDKLYSINSIINLTEKDEKITSSYMIDILSKINKDLDKSLVELIYIYYGSTYYYDSNFTMSIESLVNYLNEDVINDSRFSPFIKDNMKNDIITAKKDINSALKLLKGKNYSRMIITSNYDYEGKNIRVLINNIQNNLGDSKVYIVGDSAMSYEMSKTFNDELNLITILTMAFIFIVVAITFKSIIIPIILVLTIQCAVFTTMGILSLIGGEVYFISLLVVQAVLMGATIDYAIVYTSYYLENRKMFDIKTSVKNAYNSSIHTIITSSLILCSCTLVVGLLVNASVAKICKTIAEGAFCSTVLILFVLPGVICSVDKIIKKKK
ncbi:MAG: MMPL family transporter, partial [bacterium]|nr:MMPL family transporter [bacterium]